MTVLGDLIVPAKAQKAGDSEYPLLSMTMHNGLMDQADRFKKRIASSDLSSYKVVKRGQLVVSFPIDEGVLDFQMLYDAGIVSPAYGIWNVIDNDAVDRGYLKRLLRSPHSLAYYRQKLRGSTARRRSLPQEDFLGLPLFLPSLPEQRRIAAILDQADEIRANRRAQLAHLDELPQSLFHEMFGNQLPNLLMPLGSIATVRTGNTPSRTATDYYGPGIEWIKSNNLGGFTPTQAEEELTSLGQKQGRVAPAGSVLVTCIAGSPLSIGKASITDRDVAFNQQINAVLPSPSLNPIFLWALLRTMPELVRDKSTNGMKGLVSKSAFESILVPLPPLPDQKAFAAKVEAIRAERDRVARALNADDELFAALQHRAFRGEL